LVSSLGRLGVFAALAVAAAVLVMPSDALGEHLSTSNVETRLIALVQAPEAAVLKRLPPGWELNTYAKGPFQGANLVVLMVERLYGADPAGKPLPARMERIAALVIPVKNRTNPKQQTLMVIGGLASSPDGVPGPYKNWGPAGEFKRELSARGGGTDFGNVEDEWYASGPEGSVKFHVHFERTMATRAAIDQHVYSSVDPAFYRIYRADVGTELVRSVPAGVDRAKDVRLVLKGKWAADLFDGSEKLVAVVNMPWYVRQVFLPDTPRG
jgi:hypothetical protein